MQFKDPPWRRAPAERLEGMNSWISQARAWCAGRNWQWRLPLILLLGYTALRGLTHPMAWNWWAGITLAVHELGHVIFGPFGEVLAVAGGSITQLAAPIAAAWVLRRQGDWYGVAVGGTWLAYSLANLATYIGDARAQLLPLVGMTDNPEHDWHFLLARFGWLGYDAALARLTQFAAAVVLALSVGFALWLCDVMRRSPAPAAEGA